MLDSLPQHGNCCLALTGVSSNHLPIVSLCLMGHPPSSPPGPHIPLEQGGSPMIQVGQGRDGHEACDLQQVLLGISLASHRKREHMCHHWSMRSGSRPELTWCHTHLLLASVGLNPCHIQIAPPPPVLEILSSILPPFWRAVLRLNLWPCRRQTGTHH